MLKKKKCLSETSSTKNNLILTVRNSRILFIFTYYVDNPQLRNCTENKDSIGEYFITNNIV